MRVVQSAHGHHQVADADVQLRGEALLDPELFQFHLAALLDLGLPLARLGEFLLHGGAGAGMLEFDLRLHRPALAEVVAEVDHGMRHVEAAVRRVVPVIIGMRITVNVVTEEIAGQGHFSVAAQGQAPLLRRSLLCGQRCARQQEAQQYTHTFIHRQFLWKPRCKSTLRTRAGQSRKMMKNETGRIPINEDTASRRIRYFPAGV